MSTQPSSWINLPERLRDAVLAFKEALWQQSCMIRVAMPGIVQSFNAEAQTVVVRLAIKEMIKVNTPDGQGNTVPVITPTEIGEEGSWLQDIPVLFIGGGGFTVCPPIAAGDECLVIFGDLCSNAWWANGGVQNQEVKRRHDLSDGFAIVGLRSQPRKLTSYDASAFQVRSDDGAISMSMSASGTVFKGPVIFNDEVTFDESATFDDAVTFDGAVTVDGALQVNDTITSTGDMNAPEFNGGSGISLTSHLHGGVQNGPGITGGAFG